MTETNHKRKLIEVALPLDEINAACKADKDRKTGTIRNLHKWFAPMPLPAWRALLFASLVDDPGDDNKRVALLDLIKHLVKNGADLPDEEVLDEAKAVLAKQFPDGVPTVMDPFCGGGSTLVEAQRLGLPTQGSDLNPVPVLITRTLTQILPPLAHGEPVLPVDGGGLFSPVSSPEQEKPFEALRSDAMQAALWVLDRVQELVGDMYPRQRGEIPIAWLWVRTAPCPSPACQKDTVLTSSWWLSKKRGDRAWIEPQVVDGEINLHILSHQQSGEAPPSPKIGEGVFSCLHCGATLDPSHLKVAGQTGRMGLKMSALVTESGKGRGKQRHYREPTDVDVSATNVVAPEGVADLPIPPKGQGVRVVPYGFTRWADLFTQRQLSLMDAFCTAVSDVRGHLMQHGAREEWADAVTTLLALAVGKMAQYGSTQSGWRQRDTAHAKAEAIFGRNDLPMLWDFAEVYFSSDSVGDWMGSVKSVLSAMSYVPTGNGTVGLADARKARMSQPGLVATDPPYFDAIGYADLSDFFYIWHRRALNRIHPDLYTTLATPKSSELTALPGRHGGNRIMARDYFVEGFKETFQTLQENLIPGIPMTVVYASKEQKSQRDEQSRWASILTAMIDAELEITGTWPIHGTGSTRMRGQGSNAVATYIAMVCRPRASDAPTTSVAEFNRVLRRELGPAVRDLQAASILPVDLDQAAMGPGMRIFSRYRAVMEQGGARVPVERALALINVALAEVLDEQEGELDSASRFAVRWWDTYGWEPSTFGEADKTVRPLGISVDDVVRAQIAISRGNKVQLLGKGDLDQNWSPSADIRSTAWEAVHHLAYRLIDRGGEVEAALLMTELGHLRDPAMALVYRLHDIAAKKGRTADQERYNALINSWAELIKLSADEASITEGLF